MGAERRKGSDWVYGKKKKGSVTRDRQVQRLCGRMDCAVLKEMELVDNGKEPSRPCLRLQLAVGSLC